MKYRRAIIWALVPFSMLGIIGAGPIDDAVTDDTITNPDIVMIDGGTTRHLRGRINIDPAEAIETTDRDAYLSHGNSMVDAIHDQLITMDAQPVKITMVPYRAYQMVFEEINRAADLEPKVITMALSGSARSEQERNALMYANAKGILVLIAAGNRGLHFPDYPSRHSYEFDCVVSVSTIDLNRRGLPDRRPSWANGADIYIPKHALEDGTSYSAARAGALAMRYFQTNRTATCKEAKADLIRVFGNR